MKSIMLICLSAAVMLIMTGCPSKTLLNAPEITGVVADSNSITVTWQVDTTIENDPDFSGYNVYAATDSSLLLVEDAEDLNKSNPVVITTNSFKVTGLSQDSIYYVQVRTVNTDDKVGGYNADVPFINIQPRPEYVLGQVKMEISSPDSNEANVGITFATGALVNETNNQLPGADVFCDAYGPSLNDTVQIVTASARPNGRSTLVVKCDSTYTWNSWDFSGVNFGTSDRVHIANNDLLLCKTTEGNYVKLLVQNVDRTNNQIAVKFAYQTRPNYPKLAP